MQKIVLKNGIDIHMQNVVGFDDCIGIYVFIGSDLLISVYGSEEEMNAKIEKILERFEVLE